MPVLNKDILFDIFKKVSESQDFENIQKLFLSGKESFKIFLGLLQNDVKSVRIDFQYICFIFDSFSWKCPNFPLGIWKQVASYIPALTIDNVDQQLYTPVLRFMEHSENLNKIEVNCDISNEVWGYLLNTSVKEIRAPLRSWLSINPLIVNAINVAEVLIDYEDEPKQTVDAQILGFISSFVAPVTSLNIKIDLRDSWQALANSFETTSHQSHHVEELKIEFCAVYDVPIMPELRLNILLENFQRVFPNLKSLDMIVKSNDDDYFGFVPHADYAHVIIDQLTNQVNSAKFSYKLHLTWARIDTIRFEYDDVSGYMNSLKALNFVGDEHDYYQYWKKETKLAENKILKIEFHLEEDETNSEAYREMMDDLALDSDYDGYGFYNFDGHHELYDGAHDEIEIDDNFDDDEDW